MKAPKHILVLIMNACENPTSRFIIDDEVTICAWLMDHICYHGLPAY
jgi:hypothetical protein